MSWYSEDEGDEEIPPDDNCLCSNMNEIHQKLFLGSEDAEKKNISHIVQICSSPRQHYPNMFKYKSICASDCESFNLKEIFSETHDFIDEGIKEGTGVLVHCVAGVSRSSTICIAYLMKSYSWSFEQAVEYVRSSRQIVSPNKGFVQQLKEYQNELV